MLFSQVRHDWFLGTARLFVAVVTAVLFCSTDPSVFPGYVMPICMLHGMLMTKNYVGETSEVAGWGIYDIGAKLTPGKGGAQVKIHSTNSLHGTYYFFNKLVVAHVISIYPLLYHIRRILQNFQHSFTLAILYLKTVYSLFRQDLLCSISYHLRS